MMKLRRIISIALTSILTISQFSLPAYALEGSGGGIGNEQIDTGGTASGDWGNSLNRSGYRLSLVDANDPTQVISVDSNGETRVVDLIFTTHEKFLEYCGPLDGGTSANYYGRPVKAFKNVKTQPLSTDNNKIYQVFIPETLERIKTTDPELYEALGEEEIFGFRWMSNLEEGGKTKYIAMGWGLKEWLIIDKNNKATTIFGETVRKVGGFQNTYANGEVGNFVEANEQEIKADVTNTAQNNKPSKDKVNKPSGNTNTGEYSEQSKRKVYNNCLDTIRKLASRYMNVSAYGSKSKCYIAMNKRRSECMKIIKLYEENGIITKAQASDLRAKLKEQLSIMSEWAFGDEGYKPTASINKEYTKLADNKEYKASFLDKLFGVMTVQASTKGLDSSDGGKSEAELGLMEDNDSNSTDSAGDDPLGNHLGAILAMTDENGDHIFQTNSTKGTGKTIKHATEDWRVLIEPVDWFTPHTQGNKPMSPYRFYGTVSNIVEAMDSPIYGVNAQLANGTQKHLNFRSFNTVSWSALTTDENNSKDDEMFNSKYYFDYPTAGFGYKTNRWLADGNKPVIDANGIPHQQGWGVQVYWVAGRNRTPGGSNSSIVTWDKDKYPDAKPGPAPDAGNKVEYPDETEYGSESKKFNIVKWYYIEYPEENSEEIVDVKVREDVPHIVGIANEGNYDSDYFWKVDKWATGEKELLPVDGDLSKSYEDFCKSNPGSYIGTQPEIVTIQPTDKDKVIYVKLVMAELPSRPDIVKIYETDGETDKVTIEKNVDIPNHKYEVVTPDEGYKYVENIVTEIEYEEEPKAWTDVPEGYERGTDPSIITDEITEVIYIRYEKGDEPSLGDTNTIVLHEDELSYPYSMNSIRESLDTIWYDFPDKHASGRGRHGDDDDSWRCNWSRSLSDDNYHMTLKNGFDYGSTSFIGNEGIFAGSESGKVSTSDSDRSASINGFDTEQLIPNWLFTLYRDKSKDKVTLYPNKNSTEVTNNLSLIGIDSTSYIPSNRIATENGGNFKDTFKVGYFYESLDSTLKYKSSCSSHGSSGSYDGTASQSIDMFNSNYGTSNNIMTKYYLGKVNTGTQTADNSATPFTYDGKTYKNFMSTKNQDHTLKFYPMIKMNYSTQSLGVTNVYVTAVNESTLSAPTRVDAGVYKDSARHGLALTSNQWSTHAKVHSYLNRANIADKNSVLPGGALYNLSTSNTSGNGASDNRIGIHTYQVCVPDENVEKLADRAGVINETQAREQLTSFLSQVENVLEHYQVVQWVTTGIQKTDAEFKAASPVLVSGAGQVSSFDGNTLDRSAKYYLKVDGTNSSRADIDIVDKKQDIITWTISSDTEGNVKVQNDKGLTKTISKTQGVGVLLADNDIKLLDDRTKVVTNFINSIDRNKGSNRGGATWYNESFESIKVIENYSTYQLGFGAGNTERSSALDTKLTGKLKDRRDLYNFAEESLAEKTRTSQFKLSARSTDSSASGKAPGYIGTLDGLDIVIPNIENLLVSKLFYIPNANVTDLN